MLIGMGIVDEVVHTTLLTGYLKTDKPVSLLLIAKPESGKTTVANQRRNKHLAILSDLTGNGIVDILIERPNAKHMIINDMIALMAHKEHVNKRTIALLNQAIEEGLEQIAMPGSGAHDFKGRQFGIVCCVPSTLINDSRMWWNRSGFATRLLPFYYDLSDKLVSQIKKEAIVEGGYEVNGAIQSLPFPRKPMLIKINPWEATQVQLIANKIAGHIGNDERGLRRGKQLRALARAHALRSKRDSVNADDIAFLSRIEPYLSYTTPGELIAERREKNRTAQAGN